MNDIRSALDGLVGTPPLILGRRGAVMHRIARVNARRKVASQAVLSVLLMTGLAFGAARVVHLTPTGSDTAYTDPKPTERGHTPPPTKPSEKRDPKPVAEPTHDAHPSAEPTTANEPKPEPTKAYEPDPRPTEKPTPDSLTVALYQYGDAKAGAEMHWQVLAHDGAGRLMRVEILFGDGTKAVTEPNEPCGNGVTLKRLVGHTYAHGGTYEARLTVTTGGCDAETQTRAATATAKVAGGDTQTNGPAKPTVSAEQVAGDIARLALNGADTDGWVKGFAIDWGDGKRTYVGPRSFDGCQNADGTTHPKPSSWDPQADHAYETAGTYTVKVSVVSTSCAATDGQEAAVTITVTV
jgi:hypothetical protein